MVKIRLVVNIIVSKRMVIENNSQTRIDSSVQSRIKVSDDGINNGKNGICR